jgi:hypothetical protein
MHVSVQIVPIGMLHDSALTTFANCFGIMKVTQIGYRCRKICQPSDAGIGAPGKDMHGPVQTGSKF